MKNTILTLLASVAITAVCQAESYTLKITRPEKVGDKSEVAVKGLNQLTQKITVAGNAVKDDTTYESGSLEAVRQVLAVNDKGKATELKFTVKSLKFTADKEVEPKAILAAGKEVTAAKKGEKKSFTINGTEADEATAKALDLVIDISGEGDSSDPDAMFNTKAPHAVGDEWDASIDDFIKEMGKSMPFEFDRKASGGKARLERIEQVNGVECGVLSGVINLVPCGMNSLPEGSDLTGSTMKVTLTALVPVNPAVPVVGGKFAMEMAIKATIKDPNGGEVNLAMTSKMTRELTTKPVP